MADSPDVLAQIEAGIEALRWAADALQRIEDVKLTARRNRIDDLHGLALAEEERRRLEVAMKRARQILVMDARNWAAAVLVMDTAASEALAAAKESK